jgi:hypothetical protein
MSYALLSSIAAFSNRTQEGIGLCFAPSDASGTPLLHEPLFGVLDERDKDFRASSGSGASTRTMPTSLPA